MHSLVAPVQKPQASLPKTHPDCRIIIQALVVFHLKTFTNNMLSGILWYGVGVRDLSAAGPRLHYVWLGRP